MMQRAGPRQICCICLTLACLYHVQPLGLAWVIHPYACQSCCFCLTLACLYQVKPLVLSILLRLPDPSLLVPGQTSGLSLGLISMILSSLLSLPDPSLLLPTSGPSLLLPSLLNLPDPFPPVPFPSPDLARLLHLCTRTVYRVPPVPFPTSRLGSGSPSCVLVYHAEILVLSNSQASYPTSRPSMGHISCAPVQ